MTSQELQVRQKRELEQKQEGTVPARSFIPNPDIYETDAIENARRCSRIGGVISGHDEMHRQPSAAYPPRRWMSTCLI